jgi:hypothetical protein
LNTARGGRITIIQADDAGQPVAFADEIEFGPTEPSVSLGRVPNGSGPLQPMDGLTFGTANSRGKIGDVIISEVHFNPNDPDGPDRPQRPDNFQFIELYNRTDDSIDLTDWRIAGTTEYEFDAGTVIQPGGTVVVVPFRITSSQAAVFRFFLEAPVDLPVQGRFRPNLDDGANAISLIKHVRSSDEPRLGFDVVVDSVDFNANSPWPEFVAGEGRSLTRISSVVGGPSATAWRAAPPSPGTTSFQEIVVGDSDGDGDFDQADIVLALQGGKYLTGQSARLEDGDWNGDGLFNQHDIITALQAGTYSAGNNNAESLVDLIFREFPAPQRR